jgi:UDP-N-acetyl-D-glucosamine dehydrogenase
MTLVSAGAVTLRDRIKAREATIAVMGCGYVGLPLATAFAEAGFTVLGIEIDPRRVTALQDGHSYIMDVPDGRLRAQLDAGRFRATSDYEGIRDSDVVFVTVPTPFDRAKQPDLRFVIAAGEQIALRLRAGQLVILESTTYPGTTDEVLRPILERSGLRLGEDFYLAFSPERIDPGNRQFGIQNTPKVVGGVDGESAELATLVLEQVVLSAGVQTVSSARAAELTKLFENTFRAVNIALVNELAMLCDRMKIDVWEVIDAAATKPYGFMPFYPGPGVGGHCIPVDPYYLSWKAREFDFQTRFIELAAETNRAMPFFTATRIRRLLSQNGRSMSGARILVLGAAFKKDIDDARNSPAVRVMEILRSDGADLSYHDSFVPEVRLATGLFGSNGDSAHLRSIALEPGAIAAADCVAILVAHTGVDYAGVVANARLVFDAVNATRGQEHRANVERL